jgi:hypothetical protein
VALNTYSYLNFCRADYPTYEKISIILLDELIADAEKTENSQNLVYVLNVLPTFPFYESKTTKEVVVEDPIILSRVYFLLAVLEKIAPKLPEDVLRDKLIPLLFLYLFTLCSSSFTKFRGIECREKTINKYSHSIFAVIFSKPNPYQIKVIPTYVKISLEVKNVNFSDLYRIIPE